MTDTTDRSPALVFNPRPKSVPGDLRISWRLSMTLLVLRYCRANRASFVKLHVLNGALRSASPRRRLVEYLDGQVTVDSCTIRVEPAFSRNLDLLIGKGLGEWFVASGRLIPTVIDQNPCAHLRMPRDMIFHGWSMRLFQAWQHSATMSS